MSNKEISFILGGKRYELSRKRVEEALKDIVPRPLDKYYVNVNGRDYPPKQVLSVVLRKPLVTFTTMDAQRVLHSLGFEVGLAAQERKPKTESETLFEAYLNASGLINYVFEKAIEGTSARPDYALWFQGREILFEVKEFHATPEDFRWGGGAYDPYGPIREKIEAGRKKFKDLRGRCCALVLYNREKPLVDLSWQFIYAAMLGNLAYSFPVDLRTGKGDVDEMSQAFAAGGKMHRHDQEGHAIAAQNTTMSAVLVLQHLSVGKRRFDIETRHRQQELGRELSLEELLDMVDRARGTDRDASLTQLRVVVCENPYARILLPRELFRGPYDERYGLDETTHDRITRLYAGEQIEQLESQEGSEHSPIHRIIEDSRTKRKTATKQEPAGQV